MTRVNPDSVAPTRPKAFELYLASSVVAFFVSYVATYAYSFYYGRMAFDTQFHPGSDFPGSVVDPAVHNPEQYNVGVHFFGDFWTTLLRSFKASPYVDISDLGSSSYPPFAHVLFKPLEAFPYPLALIFFLVGGTAAVITPLLLAVRPDSSRLGAIAATCGVGITYPFLFAIDRGNNMTLAVSCCLFALFFNYRGKYNLAAIMFGLAAAIKVYPILFLLVYTHRAKIKYAFLGAATTALLTFASLLTFRGGIGANTSAFLTNLRSTGDSGVQVHLNHSLNGLVGSVAQSGSGLWSWLTSLIPTINGFRSMLIFAIVGLSILCVSNLTKDKDFTPEIVAICCVLQTLLVSLTYGYTLLIYLAVVQAIVLSARDDWWARTSAILLGVLFASKGIPVGPNPQQLLNFVNPVLQAALLLTSIVSIGFRVKISDPSPIESESVRGNAAIPHQSHADVNSGGGAP